jgi:hypothetical protein
MKLSLVLPAALAALWIAAPFASADDTVPAPNYPCDPDAVVAPAVRPRVIVFGDGAARFHVERDASVGRMTFRLLDPAVRIERVPVVVTTKDGVSREVPLVALEGQPGVWSWSGDAVRADRFDGSMRVVVAGRTYSSPLAAVWTAEGGATELVTRQARHGGRILALPMCGASVEVVQDPTTGVLTIYSFEDVVVTEAPVVTIRESSGPRTLSLTQVEGQTGAWNTTHETFKTRSTTARIRLLVNGQPCETSLVFATRPGGRVVAVSEGPSFEVVRDPRAGHYTFYEIEETFDGAPYVVENPTVVSGGRTYNLTRVEGEPRAWRLVGLDAAGSDARDGQLNYTLLGKTLSTRLGLSGLGIDVR